MKILYILRHAKSSWDNPDLSDHERPLNKRGRQAAPKMGSLMAKNAMIPDLMISSTAVRSRATAEIIAELIGYKGQIEFSDKLYAAPAETCLKILADVPDHYQSVMIVGHNPGLEELLQDLTGKFEPLPTAALAQVRLPIQKWRELLDDAAGEIVYVWRPKEI